MSEMHAAKICKVGPPPPCLLGSSDTRLLMRLALTAGSSLAWQVMDKAMKAKLPIIGLMDSGGAR